MKDLNVLFLPSWYPTKIEPLDGLFIKKHAEAVAKFCKVTVVYVIPNPNLNEKNLEMECFEDNEVYNIIIRYKRHSSLKIITLLRIIKAWRLGFKTAKEKFGNPDLVHVNVVKPNGIWALFLKFFKGIPYVISEHWSGYLPEAQNYHTGFVKKFLTKKIIKNANAVTTVSYHLADAMQKKGLKNNYFVVPNVINKNTISIEFKNSNKRKRILHVSTLDDSKKNISGILNALANIIKLRKDFEIHFVGDGIDKERLQKLSSKLFLDQHVFFQGIKIGIDLDKEFSKADFFILNSNFETFSVVAAEALAIGIPVIVTKCGGPEEFVNKDMGILVEIKNQKELEDAIIHMLENHQNYSKDKLQNYADSKFNSNIIGKQFLEVYQQILSKNNFK